ncbi:MAG: helix-turn-helix domain-containing protein [Firmicutes bacterium]|nr:helix-turn-helix domain-containing protein [Bacillota bacterium]
MTQDLRDRLREALTRAGLTQKELAERVGIQPSSIYNISKGKNASELLIRAMARELGISPDWLRDGTGIPEVPVGSALLDVIKRYGLEATTQAFEALVKPRVSVRGVFEPDIVTMTEQLKALWIAADEDTRTWIKVQFRKAFGDSLPPLGPGTHRDYMMPVVHRRLDRLPPGDLARVAEGAEGYEATVVPNKADGSPSGDLKKEGQESGV